MRAIVVMPEPEDVTAVQPLVGMVTYLTKFVPRLTELTVPLCELVHQDTEWEWGHVEKEALKKIKDAVSNAHVLRYYSLEDDVTLQCDASQSGQSTDTAGSTCGVYVMRAARYAQIEKELLSIVYAREKFDASVYGREEVTIQTDKKPLE